MDAPRRLAFRTNIRVARNTWGKLSPGASQALRELTEVHRFSVASGDLLLLGSKWYVTHSGLVGLAMRHHCAGIDVRLSLGFLILALRVGPSEPLYISPDAVKASSATGMPIPPMSLSWSAA